MVRKRKNSEETAAAPRLTRQRRVADNEDDPDLTLVEKSTKSSKAVKTPSTTRRTTRKNNFPANEDPIMSTRSRRVPTLKSSSDSDIENKSEPQRSTQKLNRSRKLAKRELLGMESYTTRSRTSKKDATATSQDSLSLELENAGDITLPESKRQNKKKKVLSATDNTLMENSSSSRALTKLTRSQAKAVAMKTNLIADSTGPSQLKTNVNSSVELKNTQGATLRRIIETPRKVSPRRQSNCLPEFGDDTITPESSPLLVNLTPHRSSKTPKKSPMNIGSPKTHSQSPLRLSRTPRKLTVSVESPATSDKSSVSTSNQSTTETAFIPADLSIPLVIVSDVSDSKKTYNPKIKQTVIENKEASNSSPTFGAVEKLRLRRSPGEITAHEKSPKTSALALSRRKKSPNKKLGTLASKVRKSPVKTPASIRRIASARLSSVMPGKKCFPAAQNSDIKISSPTKSIKKTPVNAKPMSLVNPESPRRPRSTAKKRSPITSSGTPLRPISIVEGRPGKDSVSSSSLVPLKKIHLLLELANSTPETTPRGRIRRSLHLTPDFMKFSSGSTSSPIHTSKKSGRFLSPTLNDLGQSKMSNDESIELVDAGNFINLSRDASTNSVVQGDRTYELSKETSFLEGNSEKKDKEDTALEFDKTQVDNATYELTEPKTPNLQNKSRKRSFSAIKPSNYTHDAKRRCRVRFASPGLDTGVKIFNEPANSARKSLPTVNTPAKIKTATRVSRGSSAVDSIRRRSRSLTKVDEKTPVPRSTIKRRSISVSNLSNKTPKLSQNTQNSVNRLSRPQQSDNSEAKLEIKLPVPRRAPNFAQIHQKKFEQMESLVDAKKRVAKRHIELNAFPSTRASPSISSVVLPESSTQLISNKPAPSDAQNGTFNRFGFKLRKNEAIKVIAKKPPAAAVRSKNQLENNRSILKGVRTNRRFELQMKARNIKP